MIKIIHMMKALLIIYVKVSFDKFNKKIYN